MTDTTRGEDGFTFVELLIAMSLSLVILTATLAVFTTMERGARANQQLNDAQMQARVATDTLARRLRNLASPADDPATATAQSQQPLERATAQDLIFRTVSSTGSATSANPQNVGRYRYCLRASDNSLLMQRQNWSTTVKTMPTDTACPGAGWDVPSGASQNYVVAAQHVTNGSRPVFLYEVSPTPGNYSEVASVDDPDLFSAIGLRTRLFVDPEVGRAPRETSLNTRIFLRNQNRPPTPSFGVTAVGLSLLLNASASEDPENQPLRYEWLNNGAPLVDRNGQTVAATSIAATSFAAAAGTTYALTLKVTDIGGLPTTTTAPVTVTCTATTETTPAQCIAP